MNNYDDLTNYWDNGQSDWIKSLVRENSGEEDPDVDDWIKYWNGDKKTQQEFILDV